MNRVAALILAAGLGAEASAALSLRSTAGNAAKGFGSAGAAAGSTGSSPRAIALSGSSTLLPGFATPALVKPAVSALGAAGRLALPRPEAAPIVLPAAGFAPIRRAEDEDEKGGPAESAESSFEQLDQAASATGELKAGEGSVEAGRAGAGHVFESAGRPAGAGAVSAEQSEIAALRRENAELRGRLEEKSRMISRAVHDLKNPLSPIDGYAQMLRDAPDATPKQLRWAEHILKGSRRIGVMLQDLLELGRSESAPLRSAPVDLKALLKDAAGGLEARARERGVTLGVELPEGDAAIVGDAGLIRRLVENLAGNGVKYNKEGGSLNLALLPVSGGFSLVFRDTGRGIPAEDLPKLFAPFFRSDSTRELPGTGLGLASAKAAAERHGGRIEVESSAGKGTTFRVFLPARPPD